MGAIADGLSFAHTERPRTIIKGRTEVIPGVKSLIAGIAILTLAGNSPGGDGSRLVTNLNAGRQQTIVVYGTSLTDRGVWVDQLRQALEANYPGLATVINNGRSGMWSQWGVDNLKSRVITKEPDTVLIEFAINDACLDYNTSVAAARDNLVNMIDRILAAGAETEIILMTMNPPVGVHHLRRPRIKDYYQMYREVAKERGLRLIDHALNWEKLLETERALFDRYVPDGIHPGPEGCAAVITPALLTTLGLTPECPASGITTPRPPASCPSEKNQ